MNHYQIGFMDARRIHWAALSSHLDAAQTAIETARTMSSSDAGANYYRGYAEASIIAAFDDYSHPLILQRITDDYPELAEYVPPMLRQSATEVSQSWRITTTVQMDNDDNDFIGTTTDEETYYHDISIGPRDWTDKGELIDSEVNADGLFTLMIFERFDTEYDRSAEVHFPVYITTTVERIV